MFAEYFNNTLSKMSKMKNTDTIYCSSDIVESCFGKYKEFVKANKTVGITDLALCIAALTGDNSEDDIISCFETKTVKDIKEWKKENIEETLFMQNLLFIVCLFLVNRQKAYCCAHFFTWLSLFAIVELLNCCV